MDEKLAMTTILEGKALEAHKGISTRLPYGETMANVVRRLLIDEDERQAKKERAQNV